MDFPLAVLCEKYLLAIVDEFSSYSTTEFQVKAENPPILHFFDTKYQCSVAFMILPTF